MNRKEIKKRLYENGTIGLDLSPGNKLELEAYWMIVELEKEVEQLKLKDVIGPGDQ